MPRQHVVDAARQLDVAERDGRRHQEHGLVVRPGVVPERRRRLGVRGVRDLGGDGAQEGLHLFSRPVGDCRHGATGAVLSSGAMVLVL